MSRPAWSFTGISRFLLAGVYILRHQVAAEILSDATAADPPVGIVGRKAIQRAQKNSQDHRVEAILVGRTNTQVHLDQACSPIEPREEAFFQFILGFLIAQPDSNQAGNALQKLAAGV